jgi:hypothetical protein
MRSSSFGLCASSCLWLLSALCVACGASGKHPQLTAAGGATPVQSAGSGGVSVAGTAVTPPLAGATSAVAGASSAGFAAGGGAGALAVAGGSAVVRGSPSGAGSGASMPAAGSGGSVNPAAGAVSAQPVAGGAGGSDCATRYSTAVRMSVDMSWPDSIGYKAGQGKLLVWIKLTHTPHANGSTSESIACGVSLPVVTTSPLLDSIQLSNEIPAAAFDRPSMPRFAGHSEWKAGVLVIDPGVNLLGVMLSDPSAPWPARAALVPLDHDGDGMPGITAMPKQGGVFGLPPIDIGQTQHADQIYIASRIALRLSAPRAGCNDRVEGSLEPLSFDYTIVGCHAQDRDDCKPKEVDLLATNSPTFTLGAQGHWTSLPSADTASCADVLTALPAE